MPLNTLTWQKCLADLSGQSGGGGDAFVITFTCENPAIDPIYGDKTFREVLEAYGNNYIFGIYHYINQYDGKDTYIQAPLMAYTVAEHFDDPDDFTYDFYFGDDLGEFICSSNSNLDDFINDINE